MTSRRARVCELDPVYCDRINRRWEACAKDEAEQVACGIGPALATPARAASLRWGFFSFAKSLGMHA